MASYAEDHASYAEEQRNRARDHASSSRLDRNDPLLASFFETGATTDSPVAVPALFANLAQALQNHDEGVNNPLMARMIAQLLGEASAHESPQGVKQEFLDTLDRVPKSSLKVDDACPICATPYLDDKYPLVVSLKCRHRFDLECITPWLKLHTTCPMCRADVQTRRLEVTEVDSEEEYDDTYG